MTFPHPHTGQAGTDATRCESSNTSHPELLRDKDAAALLDIGTRTLHRLASEGKAPKPMKIGGSVRWRRGELLAWIAEGCPRTKGGVA